MTTDAPLSKNPKHFIQFHLAFFFFYIHAKGLDYSWIIQPTSINLNDKSTRKENKINAGKRPHPKFWILFKENKSKVR